MSSIIVALKVGSNKSFMVKGNHPLDAIACLLFLTFIKKGSGLAELKELQLDRKSIGVIGNIMLQFVVIF